MNFSDSLDNAIYFSSHHDDWIASFHKSLCTADRLLHQTAWKLRLLHGTTE